MNKLAWAFTYLFFISTAVLGQNKYERETVKFISRSTELIGSTGWGYNFSKEKWISNKNVIDSTYVNKPDIGQIKQNFKWMQLVKVGSADQEYSLILFETLSGEYQFPSLKMDWVEESKTYWFLIDSAQLNRLFNMLEKKESDTILIESKKHGYTTDRYVKAYGYGTYSDEFLLATISGGLLHESPPPKCFVFKYMVNNGDEVVRFLLPEVCSNAPNLFERNYFEASYSRFISILK